MNMVKNLAASLLLAVMAVPAYAGSAPNWTYGYVPTSAEWNAEFASKEDELGYRPVNSAGDTMSGRLITAAPGTSTSGLNLTPGSTPGSPANGDAWVTSVGLFVQINGSTVGPLIGASGANFAATSPLTVAASAGLVTYACPTCGVTGSPLSQFAATSSAQLAGVLSDETGTGVVVFSTSPVLTTPNLGTPSAIVLTSGTGLPVASGISGLATGMATFLATPTSANLAATVTNETGTGNLVFATSPTLVTPTLGAAVATSILVNDSGLITNASTSGNLTIRAAATSGASVVRFPAGSTDFSATGGTSQFVKQTSSGGALTVAAILAGDLPLATNAAMGGMRGDGTTISCVAGVCQGIGASATAIAVGTTNVNTGTSGFVLTNNAGVLGNSAVGTLVTANAASKTDQQTGTSTTTIVTPSQQQQHDSATKAWGTFNGGTGALVAGYNMALTSHTAGSGVFVLNFPIPFASATGYACTGSGTSLSNAVGVSINAVKTASSLQIVTFVTNTGSGTDINSFDIECHGRQ